MCTSADTSVSSRCSPSDSNVFRMSLDILGVEVHKNHLDLVCVMSYDENWTLDSRVSGARVAFDDTVRIDGKCKRNIDDIRDSKRLHFSRRVGDRVSDESERE